MTPSRNDLAADLEHEQEQHRITRAERDRLRAALERHHRPYAPLTRPCDICGVDPTEAPASTGPNTGQHPTEPPSQTSTVTLRGTTP